MPAERLSTLNVPEYGLRLRLLEEYCLVAQVLLPRRRLVAADAGRGARDTVPVPPVARHDRPPVWVCPWQVVPFSAADQSGLEMGDILEQIDARPV